MSENRIMIIGGDKRQLHLFEILQKEGYSCIYENSNTEKVFSELKESRYIVLPVPLSKNGKHIYSDNRSFKLEIDDFLSAASDDKILLGSSFPQQVREILNKRNIVYSDMSSNDDFTVYNALLTAQGALALLLSETHRLIARKPVLITGYGRIATSLVPLLKALGADVTVSARNSVQLTKAFSLGCNTVKIRDISKTVHTYDYIINTVPDEIFSYSDVASLKNDALYMELASRPYGAPESFFHELNKQRIDGSSLPGRLLYESAGERIAEFVRNLV